MTTIRWMLMFTTVLRASYSFFETSENCTIAKSGEPSTKGLCLDIRKCPKVYAISIKPTMTRSMQHYYASVWAACNRENTVCCEQPDIGQPTSTVTPESATTTEFSELYQLSMPLLPEPIGLEPWLRCGNGNFTNKISGGDIAQPGDHRWAVFLNYTSSINSRCGGTLISNRYVLTAAHCVKDVAADDLIIHLGEHNLTSGFYHNTSIPVVKAKVEKLIMHQEYNDSKKIHDIALIRLDKTYEFTEHMYPACLPLNLTFFREETFQGNFSVAGWGAVSHGIPSDVKRMTTLEHFPLEKCIEAYGGWSDFNISNSNICATGNETNFCDGDSGGPLMYKKQDIWYLIGVINFGGPCPSTGTLPGVYSRVTSYMDWIMNNLNVDLMAD